MQEWFGKIRNFITRKWKLVQEFADQTVIIMGLRLQKKKQKRNGEK